jgi:3-oxoacyl-[acyl-carrier protein] reductase
MPSAIVTGASRGIGRAIAVELGRRSYHTALVARDATALRETATMVVEASGPEPIVEQADVTDPDQLEAAMSDAVERLDGALDVLVNNAGAALARMPLEELGDGEWQAGLDLNLMAAVRASRHCFEALRAGHGCIVNISSVVASRASVTGGVYVVAKAALESLTRMTAVEWARYDIRCLTVAPGFVDTGFNEPLRAAGLTERLLRKIPTREAIRAEEVAKLVADLSDPGYTQLTGTVVAIDGSMGAAL